ncbi:MAG: ComF family protein [Acidimicrobiales bacterium]
MRFLLTSMLPARCALCGRPGAGLCAGCAAGLAPAPPGPVAAVLAYEGEAPRVVAALKHRQARRLLPSLGRAMALRLPPRIEAVTWAPTSPERRRRRGGDQAEALARAVAAAYGVPCRRLLVRAAGDVAQMGRSRADRLGSPPQFHAVGRAVRSVALVDDVVTTGATLASATRCLLAAGCREVHPVVVAARVPSRGDLGPRTAAPGRS